MKPPPFEYADPKTMDEVMSLLQEHASDAKLLAGGQSLVPLLNMRLARPSMLVDLGRIPDLDYIRESNGGLAIGAMTRQRTIEHSLLVEQRQPLLHAATRFIAHPQIRNRGTIGGSLAHADPAAVYPAVTTALEAEFRVRGPQGERVIGARDFFVSYLTTALEPAEVLAEVRVPALPERTGWSFMEVARRRGDFAMAGVAVILGVDGRGRCARTRIVLFGVGPTPFRARAAEQPVDGEPPSEKLFERAAQQASAAVGEPLSDVHASAAYRRHLAGVLVRRALAEAAARAGR